jgi:hypothetical protein
VSSPDRSDQSGFSGFKRFLLGKPIPSHLAHHERLSRVTGLAVLSSRALSSVACTDFILITLLRPHHDAAAPVDQRRHPSLLAIVAFSYRQTIHAYPTGGGACHRGQEHRAGAGLIAAASLLVDYTLTVSVSISAGVLALTSAEPALAAYRVELCLSFLAILMLGNLRGIRESGRIFAVPTYFFVVSIFVLLAIGFYRYASGAIVPLTLPPPANAGSTRLTVFLLYDRVRQRLHRDDGCRAVSNGVPAFRPPESKNASATLVWMAVLAITMFLGITVLAHAYHVMPTDQESGLSQLGGAIFGSKTALYYIIQAATMMILVLAANTAFADFPRLSSIVSRDGFLPRQFMNQGDRLAFSNGIIVLSVFAPVLIVGFRGATQSLLPLYDRRVHSFTLSQAGMVIPGGEPESGLEDERAHQRLRRLGNSHRAGHRRGHQDARRRLDRAAAHSDHRRHLPDDQAALHPRLRPVDAPRIHAAAPRAQPGAGPHRRHPARGRRSAAVRRIAVG